MDKTPQTSNKPIAELKSGAVVATIWPNEGQNGPYHNIVVTRFYKDRDGQWQRTKSLRPKDMPDVTTVAGQVTEKLAELGAVSDDAGTDAPPEAPAQEAKAPKSRKAKKAP